MGRYILFIFLLINMIGCDKEIWGYTVEQHISSIFWWIILIWVGIKLLDKIL